MNNLAKKRLGSISPVGDATTINSNNVHSITSESNYPINNNSQSNELDMETIDISQNGNLESEDSFNITNRTHFSNNNMQEDIFENDLHQDIVDLLEEEEDEQFEEEDGEDEQPEEELDFQNQNENEFFWRDDDDEDDLEINFPSLLPQTQTQGALRYRQYLESPLEEGSDVTVETAVLRMLASKIRRCKSIAQFNDDLADIRLNHPNAQYPSSYQSMLKLFDLPQYRVYSVCNQLDSISEEYVSSISEFNKKKQHGYTRFATKQRNLIEMACTIVTYQLFHAF